MNLWIVINIFHLNLSYLEYFECRHQKMVYQAISHSVFITGFEFSRNCSEMFFIIFSWKLPLNPIKIPVFYYKSNGHLPHTFIYDDDEKHIHVWGLPELEYKGLVKVNYSTGWVQKNDSPYSIKKRMFSEFYQTLWHIIISKKTYSSQDQTAKS